MSILSFKKTISLGLLFVSAAAVASPSAQKSGVCVVKEISVERANADYSYDFVAQKDFALNAEGSSAVKTASGISVTQKIGQFNGIKFFVAFGKESSRITSVVNGAETINDFTADSGTSIVTVGKMTTLVSCSKN